MKKILVPVDFSKMSSNALNYAAQLAKRAGARIHLLHVCYAPVTITTNSTFAPPSAEQLRRESLAALERLKRRTEKRYADLTIGYECINGFAVDEIPLYAQKNKYDLIVMGTQGAGFLSERLLGSTATSVMGRATTAVLAIDRKVRFRPAERIVFATDFVETRPQVLKPLKDLAQLFNAEIFILNIVLTPIVAPAMEEMIAAYKLNRTLKNIHHTFFYLHRADVVEGINDFVSSYKMDMAAMISRRHSFLGRLLAEPHTKHMAFHSKVPLLALQATND